MSASTQAAENPDHARRREAMAVLAAAETAELSARLDTIGTLPEAVEIRKPEIGLVMLRGRVGGTGTLFNLGEATVARAAVQLGSGETGFSYVLGRDLVKARLAALVDAMLQSAARREAIEAQVLAPLRDAIAARTALKATRAAATKVEFFTLVRGED